MNMKMLFLLAAAVAFTATPALAQERTAGQAYDAQVNWSALNGAITALKDQNKLLAQALDAISTCNAKGMFYTPGGADIDADKCAKSVCPSGTTAVGTDCVDNAVTTLTAAQMALDYGQLGQGHAGAAKACAAAGKRVATLQEALVQCVAGKISPGGNYVVNVAPYSTLFMPSCQVDRSTGAVYNKTLCAKDL